MIRSLYSGVSGLTTHQTRMDVIGNNIANVNTIGYKSQRTTFKDIYYQTHISPTAGKNAYAGNNPAEVGYGVQLSSIDKDMSQSSGQSSNSMWDMMINGDGFFMTATYDGINVSSDLRARSVQFTRAGNFTIDSYGNLATSNNRFVIGSRNTLAGLQATGSISEKALNDVEIKDRNGDDTVNSSDITFRNTINLDELVQTAWNIYTDDQGNMYGIDWDALIRDDRATEDEDVTPDNSTFIVYDYDGTDEAFRGLTDEQKKEYIDVQQTLINLSNTETTLPKGSVGGDAAGEDENNPTRNTLDYRYYVDTTGARIDLKAQTLPAEENAEATTLSTYKQFYENLVNADDVQDVATTTDVNEHDEAISTAKSLINTAGGLQGALHYSELESIFIGKDGTIQGTYNGDLKFLARVDLATFENPQGLAEAGDTAYTISSASGDARIKKPGDSGAGTIKNKYVEMSNVNLANEFSDMIVTQRGYQANARMITTSDEMLEELVNLVR